MTLVRVSDRRAKMLSISGVMVIPWVMLSSNALDWGYCSTGLAGVKWNPKISWPRPWGSDRSDALLIRRAPMGWGVRRVVHEPARFHLNQSGLCGERIVPLVHCLPPLFVGHDIERKNLTDGVDLDRADVHGFAPFLRRPFDDDLAVEPQSPCIATELTDELLLPENELHW